MAARFILHPPVLQAAISAGLERALPADIVADTAAAIPLGIGVAIPAAVIPVDTAADTPAVAAVTPVVDSPAAGTAVAVTPVAAVPVLPAPPALPLRGRLAAMCDKLQQLHNSCSRNRNCGKVKNPTVETLHVEDPGLPWATSSRRVEPFRDTPFQQAL
jgi:hypothetical protein